MVDDGVGDALARLAGRQDGIVTSADLVALGITHRQIHGWCRNGRLQRLRRGLFAVGYQPNNQRAHRRAGLLAVGPTSALGFSTSLSHREIVELRGEEDLLHVVTGCGSPRSPDGVTLHRLSFLDERDIDVVDGLRCTSVALTLIHLAGSLASSDLQFVCERVEYARRLDVKEIAATMARMAGPRGARALREVLADASLETGLLDSNLERRVLRLLADAGLPNPIVQQRFDLSPDVGVVRVDFWYPQARLVVEVDGPHHGLPLQRAKDSRRDAAFARRGIAVLRIGYQDVEVPGFVVRSVHDALVGRSSWPPK